MLYFLPKCVSGIALHWTWNHMLSKTISLGVGHRRIVFELDTCQGLNKGHRGFLLGKCASLRVVHDRKTWVCPVWPSGCWETGGFTWETCQWNVFGLSGELAKIRISISISDNGGIQRSLKFGLLHSILQWVGYLGIRQDIQILFPK